MRILLVATNRHNSWMSKREVRPLPIGLAYVASYIDTQRHSLRILDLMFSEDYLADTEQAVREFEPEMVGISIRNLDNGSYVNPQSALPITKEVIDCIRGCSDAVITCGGPAFSTLPRACFQYLQPDFGLVGDATETFALLAKALEKGKPYHKLPGLVYCEEGQIKMSPQRASSSLARPPRLDDLDLDKYRRAGFGVGVITKLGWYTSTVANPTPEEEWRVVRPVKEVIDEVRRLQDTHNIAEFFFIDQAFNRPMDYAKDLCRNILSDGLSIKWSTNLSKFGFDQELISLMVRSGCQTALVAGAIMSPHSVLSEGYEEKVQLASDLSALQRLCDMCQKEGLAYSITQGFGEPSESRDTIRTKLAFLCTAAGPERATPVNLRVGNRVLPGTDLGRRAMQEGLIKSDCDLLMPVFYVAPAVRDELLETLEAAVEGHPSWSIM
jgi:hypothetical protein